jgi:hypothetical protein
MSVLNAFLSTWSNARQTYGEGTPQTGAQYDGSSTLNQLQSTVQSAAPGSKWSGGAANAYGAANTEHGRVLGQLAGLDQRLSAHVDQSAEVVAAGRRDLDAVRKWVVDAAASVPQNAAGERMQMAIVQKGISQVQEIIQRSNGELNAIGGKIRGLGNEYQALDNQKFGIKEGPDFVDGKRDDEEKRRQAEKDVHDALAGNQDAAKRVESLLDGIKPGQQLTPEQASYLSQMQAQQNGMSVDALKTAEQRLGDQKHIIADSWQLMSNDDDYFPKTPKEAGGLDDPSQVVKGSFDQLPQSVQQAIKSPGVQSPEEMKDISAIVKDGNPALQTGTELDREMIRKADRMMDDPMWDGDLTPTDDPAKLGRDTHFDPIVSDIFESAGRDHQIVHDHLLGTHGDDGDDFLHDINRHAWADKGTAAGSLFNWTENAHGGPESQIAAETAEKYATYIGSHEDELMDLPGHNTLGELNPELTKAYAHGLGNYIPDIADLSTADRTDAFGAPDGGDKDMNIAKGIFSALSTDKDASDWFNGKATAAALAAQSQYADAVKHGAPNLERFNDKLLDATVLKGLVECGTVNAAHSTDLNGHEQAMLAYERQKSAYDFGVKAATTVTGFIPKVGDVISTGIGEVAPALQESFIGPPPGPAADAPIVSNLGWGEAAQVALNPLIAAGVPVTGLPDRFLVPINPDHLDQGMRIGTVEEIAKYNNYSVSPNTWQNTLNNVATYTVGAAANPVDDIAQRYEDLVKKPDP